MKIDVTRAILDLDDEPVEDTNAKGESNGEMLTLRKVVQRACLAMLPSDQNRSGEEKGNVAFFAFAARNDNPELTVEEWAKIKARIGEYWSGLVIYRAFAMIEEGKPAAIEKPAAAQKAAAKAKTA